MDRYAVFGNPIAHSKSPVIHTEFAHQTDQVLSYEALLAPLDGFAETVRQFIAENGRGMNVTVPFKEQAWALVDERSVMAEKAGAVNTISVLADGRLRGDNTDGLGLVRDLTVNHDLTLKDKRILVIGAGGAVRGVLGPILAQQPAELVVVNRTLEKAQLLAELFADEGEISASSFDGLAGQFDVVINGTAASLEGKVPPVPEECISAAACYDMMYANEPTSFMAWAQQHGAAQTMDGLGMLLEQAAEAFAIWRDVRPDTACLMQQMRG
jgi:shikimate dehydrogenase